MANHKSAIKRHKQDLKRAMRNRARRTRVKNVVKDVRAAIEGKDKSLAESSLSTVNSVVAKAASKGAIHWRKAARKISRLARAVNAMQAQ